MGMKQHLLSELFSVQGLTSTSYLASTPDTAVYPSENVSQGRLLALSPALPPVSCVISGIVQLIWSSFLVYRLRDT